MEMSLALSITSKAGQEQKAYCEQAREYGEVTLGNVLICEDACKIAQVRFLLACVGAWKVCVDARIDVDAGRREWAEMILRESIRALNEFPNLKMQPYEAQAAMYIAHLNRVPCLN
jgi:hypothetical protein